MNFAFAGTPDFAAWVLEDLKILGRRPCVVISQPDRPCGRGRRRSAPPAVIEASRQGIPHIQTDDINHPNIVEQLLAAGASALLVAAFGQMLKPPLLNALLCLNVHASLLPDYRGAAPIERALAAGEPRTGITIMRVTEQLDEGPMALQTSVAVGLREDAGTLGRTLAMLGAVGTAHVLDGLTDGTIIWREQCGAGSYAQKITSRDCVLDVTLGAGQVHNRVRSLSPFIGARAKSGDVEFKIWRTWPYGESGLAEIPPGAAAAVGRPGRLVVQGERLYIGCGEGVLELLVVQPAGKNKMAAPEFLRGYGRRLGELLETGEGPGGQCGCE